MGKRYETATNTKANQGGEFQDRAEKPIKSLTLTPTSNNGCSYFEHQARRGSYGRGQRAFFSQLIHKLLWVPSASAQFRTVHYDFQTTLVVA